MLMLRQLLFSAPQVKCPEESLYLTQTQGYGFYPGAPGEKLKDGCYEIIRKLGGGSYSSTWLVSYTQGDRKAYKALKVLTAKATELWRKGVLHELEFLQAIAKLHPIPPLLPRLRGHFLTTGPHGEHLCLVLDVLSTDINAFRLSTPRKTLPLHVVQKITSDVVEALVQLHSINIIHTDIKPDNILFKSSQSAGWIEPELAVAPPVIEGHVNLDGTSYPIVRSQPIPHKWTWGTWANKPPTTEMVTPFALRAPEVILRAGFDVKVDIWALGCIVFELLTGHWLFHPSGGKTWNIVDDHLAKMQEFTGETFSTNLLSRAKEGKKIFDDSGKLLRIQTLNPVSIEQALSNYNVLDPDDISAAAAFIRVCICLDPKDRPTAAEISKHNWIAGADWCRDYRVPK